MKDQYATPEESAAVITPYKKTPSEVTVDAMLDAFGANEQGAVYAAVLYRVAVKLAEDRRLLRRAVKKSKAKP